MFFRILLWEGQLELLRSKEGYIVLTTLELRIGSINKRLSLFSSLALLLSPLNLASPPSSRTSILFCSKVYVPLRIFQRVFPLLIEPFKCDVFQLAKHHRATYPYSNTKRVHSCDLVHFDVWGPTSNSSISSAK